MVLASQNRESISTNVHMFACAQACTHMYVQEHVFECHLVALKWIIKDFKEDFVFSALF